ncbi:hypothetical protein HN873_051702 [Arachis hypogaea]
MEIVKAFCVIAPNHRWLISAWFVNLCNLRDLSRILSPYKKILQLIENTRNVKLDIRTKLCLRDSLYRLAKSAEQRHNDSIANGCTRDDQACKSMVPHNGSRCMRFMDMETDTNPIDRSIAHLLFYRPHDQSMSHPYDSIPFKSSATWLSLLHSSKNYCGTQKKPIDLSRTSRQEKEKMLNGS